MQLRAYAKINLSLRVLHKRGDGYHELRTIFQTISLADTVSVEARRARTTRITLDDGGLNLPNNLMTRAAEAYLEAAKTKASVAMTLQKRIPMGGGLGGGSTDAAAVLLALHRQLGKQNEAKVDLQEIAARLGADIPFFLDGGTALGIGRGEEIYPLKDLLPTWGVLATPEVHVSTPEAFRTLARQPLGPELTSPATSLKLKRFQALSRSVAAGAPRSAWKSFCENDFEAAVFLQHPVLKQIRDKLARQGAEPARMTGSGAALFGLFDSKPKAEQAAKALAGSCAARVFTLIGRRRYQAQWSTAP
jgi:4-diphosphocytidyl-2-C-methyl-D-erythritol kinase